MVGHCRGIGAGITLIIGVGAIHTRTIIIALITLIILTVHLITAHHMRVRAVLAIRAIITIALVWLLVVIRVHQDLRIEVEVCDHRNLRPVEARNLYIEEARLIEAPTQMARHRIAVARQTPEQPHEVLLVEVRHTPVAEVAMSVVDSLRILRL